MPSLVSSFYIYFLLSIYSSLINFSAYFSLIVLPLLLSHIPKLSPIIIQRHVPHFIQFLFPILLCLFFFVILPFLLPLLFSFPLQFLLHVFNFILFVLLQFLLRIF
jgi:hypothetical protein